MALNDSVLSELLDALKTGNGDDPVRQLAEWAIQQLIEVEGTEKIGAARYERNGERVTQRNGHRPRVLSTKAVDMHLKIHRAGQWRHLAWTEGCGYLSGWRG